MLGGMKFRRLSSISGLTLRSVACLVAFLICGSTAVAQQPAAPAAAGDDPVVLTVGSEQITRSMFERIISTLSEQQRAAVQTPEARRSLAEQIAELKVMAQEGRARKLDLDPEVQMRLVLQAERVLASEVYAQMISAPAGEADLRAYYDEHRADWEEAVGRHILIRFQGSSVPLREGQEDLTDEQALAKIQQLRESILAGADFSEVAKAESDDQGSGQNGGQLGAFKRGEMIEEFDATAFSIPLGEVSEPIKTAYGYHLIIIDERNAEAFEDVRDEIQQRIAPELGARAIDELTKNAGITYDETYFGPAPEQVGIQ